MIPTYIIVILTVLVIFIVVAIFYGIKWDLEDADFYKAEVDSDQE